MKKFFELLSFYSSEYLEGNKKTAVSCFFGTAKFCTCRIFVPGRGNQAEVLGGYSPLFPVGLHVHNQIIDYMFTVAPQVYNLKGSVLLVHLVGLEPTRYCYHTDLNRARLPIPPQMHGLYVFQKENSYAVRL